MFKNKSTGPKPVSDYQDPNDCFNSSHEHQFLPLQNHGVKSIFEPVPVEKYGEAGLYKLRDYVVMFCKCGTTKMDEPPKNRLEESDGKS